MTFLATCPSVNYIKDHMDNVGDFLISSFHVPGLVAPMFSYMTFAYHKVHVNEVFNEIERLVNRRMKKCDNGAYEQTIKMSNIYVKYPFIIVFGLFFANICIAVVIFALIDLRNGEFHTEKWYLAYPHK